VAKGFLEATQQRLSVGGECVRGIRYKTRVIVNDHAQVSGHRFGMQGQERPRREVDDPEVIDAGRLEGLGGTRDVLAQQIAAAVSIQIVLFQASDRSPRVPAGWDRLASTADRAI
jgi:hypothetical protein